jgi:hypothetical protein
VTDGTLDAHTHTFAEIAAIVGVEPFLTFEAFVVDLRAALLDAQETFQWRLIVLITVVGLVLEG